MTFCLRAILQTALLSVSVLSLKMELRGQVHLQLFSLFHCRSLRYLSWNQLTGTIPPQLGSLSQLIYLYHQNRIALI